MKTEIGATKGKDIFVNLLPSEKAIASRHILRIERLRLALSDPKNAKRSSALKSEIDTRTADLRKMNIGN